MIGFRGNRVGWVLLLLLGLGLASSAGAGGPRRYWVYLKADAIEKGNPTGPPAVSPRAAARMARVGRHDGADPLDYRLPESLLAPIRERGLEIRRVSRFLRAASVWMDASQARELASDPRVLRVTPVSRFVRPLEPTAPAPSEEGPPGDRSSMRRGGPLDTDPRTLAAADYGAAWDQVAMMGVPEMHARGYAGDGVLIAVFDTGFYKTHASLSPLARVAERDFVCGDDEVQYYTGDPCGIARANDHGTFIWSTIGGFAPGKLLGPAYRAEFALAKTEDVTREVHQEEDDYIAALEWADSLGADVVSSSLGYRTFDDGTEYTVADLDGRTAPITIATDVAADRGILVVTAMGNEGPGASTLGVPADGRRVVSVGAVDMSGVLAQFSSCGPTGDGRTKPDVVALGVATYCASASSPNVYARVNGTSLSTPLISGLAALLIQARPAWGPDSVAAALRRSGNNGNDPTNTYGWGVPDGLRALRIEDARLLLGAPAWNDTEPMGDGNGVPGWDETGILSVRVRNVGLGASGASSLWPGAHDSRVALLDSAAVLVSELAPGDSVEVQLGRVTIGSGQGRDALPILLHLDTAGVGTDRRIYLPILPSHLVTSFDAEADEAGAVRLSWRLQTDAAVGVQVYRWEFGSERVLLSAAPLPPDSMTFLDRPGRPGTYHYGIEIALLGGFVSRAGPLLVILSEPTRVRIGMPYPNPAALGAVRIPLAWPGSEPIEINIYAVSGRRCVRTLRGSANGELYPSLTWDLKDESGDAVSSGIYFARAPGGEARRIIVVR